MEKRILETLEQIEWEQDVEILFACESGSRAWRFASPDSDYDVRFIYAGTLNDYLTIGRTRDVIERPIEDELDVNGWDVRKALALLRSSNPTVLEWLHSPVIYRANDSFLESMMALAMSAMRPRSLYHHYLSMARNDWLKRLCSGQATAKRYLYVLRTLLCAQWVVERETIPPVAFGDLVEAMVPGPRLRAEIDRLLAIKSGSREKEVMPRHPVLDAFIEGTFKVLEGRPPVDTGKPPVERFDAVLMDALGA